MSGRFEELSRQLPSSGLGRTAVLASLIVGGLVATGLTALIVMFVVASLRSGPGLAP